MALRIFYATWINLLMDRLGWTGEATAVGEWLEALTSNHLVSHRCFRSSSNPARTMCENIRIFHGWEVRIEKSVRGSLFGIMRLCRVMLNSDPGGRIFLSASNNYDRFFFLHIFWSPAFYFKVEVTFNESGYNTLTSAILKVDVVCDVAMTSTSNVLTT